MPSNANGTFRLDSEQFPVRKLADDVGFGGFEYLPHAEGLLQGAIALQFGGERLLEREEGTSQS